MATEFYTSSHDPELINMLTQKIQQNTLKEGQCQLWSGQVNKYGYGYIRITFQGKRVKLSSHRLNYFLLNSQSLAISMHVSHLCHKKLCVKQSHLSYEPQAVNNNRKSCVLNDECSGHHGYPRCLLGNNINVPKK